MILILSHAIVIIFSTKITDESGTDSVKKDGGETLYIVVGTCAGGGVVISVVIVVVVVITVGRHRRIKMSML